MAKPFPSKQEQVKHNSKTYVHILHKRMLMVCFYPGQENFGNIIRQIDYFRGKGKYEYKNEINPYDLLENFRKNVDCLGFNHLKVWRLNI